MQDIDLFDVGMGCFFGLLLLALGGTVGAGVFDMVQDRRSYDAQVACSAQRMESRRQSFTTRVVCVPAITRQDTTTVRVQTP